jgi:streptomycin 6-kinase
VSDDAVAALPLPSALAAAIAGEGDGRRGWVDSLPAVLAHVRQRWALEVGDPFQPGGQTAWVAPVRTGDGRHLVLKLAWRHDEAMHEAEGLRLWDGDGAVRLLGTAEFDRTTALLLERCRPGTTLAAVAEADQDTVVAGLLLQLWREPPAGHPFRPLRQMCDAWADGAEEALARTPLGLDTGLVREAVTLFRTLPGTTDRSVVLCTDLHAGNVLAAERQPWLVIDPKPYVGDPTYDPLQHMLNCEARLRADPVGLARRLAGLLDLDADRLLLWLFARCVIESASAAGRALVDVARQVAPR